MKRKITKLCMTALLCFFGIKLSSQVCNSSGNLMLFTNYDGGTLTINVDQNIPNLKIGVCSYEGVKVVLTGAFVSNVVEIHYAGYNGNNVHCTYSISTNFAGQAVGTTTSIAILPSTPLSNPNGYGQIICGYSCSNSSNQGGCNTVDQIEAYFLNYFTGSSLFAHKVQYGCWTGTHSVSVGGSCCPPPPVYAGSVTASQTICAGDTPAAFGSAASATISSGTILYQWQSSSSPSSGFTNISLATNSTYAPTALTANTYYRRAASTSTANIAYSNTITIDVIQVPVVNITGPSSLCAGSSATLSASGGTSFVWSTGATSSLIVISPTNSAVWTITCNPGACPGIGTTSITVHLPVITGSASPATICAGESATLSASGGTSYAWEPGSLTGATVVVLPTSTQVYTITGTDANGCTGITQINVSVNPLPVLTIAVGNTIACSGTTVALAGAGATNYTWLPGGQTGPLHTFTASVTESYTLVGETSNCTVTSIQPITVIPSPVISVMASRSNICRNETTTLTANGGTTYTWPNSSVAGPVLNVSPTSSTVYVIGGTAVNGCVNQASIAISVFDCVGINEEQAAGGNVLQVYPNPSSSEFTIKANSTVELEIINSAGQLIRIIELNEKNNYSATFTNLSPGIYFVSSKNRTGGVKQKIIVTD